jgi:hypothetical protein
MIILRKDYVSIKMTVQEADILIKFLFDALMQSKEKEDDILQIDELLLSGKSFRILSDMWLAIKLHRTGESK